MWVDYTKPYTNSATTPYDFTIPQYYQPNSASVDDQQDCVLVKSMSTKNIVDDSHLFLTTQFNRLFDTGDKVQDIKMWSGMPITIVTQVGKDLSVGDASSAFKTFDY
jgi:hypothetical protein